MLAPLLLSLVALAQAPKCSVSGEFQKTHWGQSWQKVQTFYPASELYWRGADAVLIDKSVGSVGGFAVSEILFMFGSEGLKAVMVDFTLSTGKDQQIEFFERLFQTLNAKYGQPTGFPSGSPQAKKYPLVWFCKSARVFVMVQESETGKDVSLNYASRKAGAADQL